MTKDPELRKSYRFRACVICGKRKCDPSHVKTYGSSGVDSETNIIPLCREHHIEWGSKGAVTTTNKYPRLKNHLIAKGWEIIGGKLIHSDIKGKDHVE